MHRTIACLLLGSVALAPSLAFGQGAANPQQTSNIAKTYVGCPSQPSTPCAVPQFNPTSAGTGQFALAVTAATGLAIPPGTNAAIITVEGQSVRCRDDGTAPTSTTGMLYVIGTFITEWQPALASFQCIQTAGTATLDVEYYK